MENVILIVHLLLALALIAVVLLQRSEGGGLGMGGGGGGVMSGRAASTPLGKVTWGLAIAFIATSMTLTIIAAANSENASVVDRLQDVPRAPATAPGDIPSADDLLPPSLGGGSNAPLVPQAAD
ncbi:MAG: preprotein translocase subunit SecG [Pseudomonadota bacterium]